MRAMPAEHISLIASLPLFKGLASSDIEHLASFSFVRKYQEGDALFYEKDAQDAVYYIVEGAIKFYKVDRFDNEIFLYKLDSNSLILNAFKFVDTFLGSCYANAEFLEESLILSIQSQPFREMLHANHALMTRILEESFKMTYQMQSIINRDVVFEGMAKVAHMLAHDMDTFNRVEKHEIAYMLHLQPETLSRILNKLIRNGTISIEKNNIIILDEKELRQIYE